MTFTRLFFPASKAISKGIRTGYRSAVAVCVAGLLVTMPPTPLLASPQSGTGSFDVSKFDTSFNIGPIAVSLQMTKPIQTQTGVVWDTLHIEARDDTQSPPFHATLDAVGQAADAATLFGGFLPCVIVIQQDLASGLSLAQAEADCYAKTGVTITSFHDGLVEFTLIIVLTTLVIYDGLKIASPPLNPQLSAILAKMQASLAKIGGTEFSALLANVLASLEAIGGSPNP